MLKEIEDRITEKAARIGVIGLGYVGLPLAVEFAMAGFKVTGIDLDKKRLRKLKKGVSYIPDVDRAVIRKTISKGTLKVTADYRTLERQDAIIICVPTPLSKTREPDISYIIAAIKEVGRYLKKGQIIVLESTTYPGTTEEVILPSLQKKSLRVGKDFFLAFSPERIDPGNKVYTTGNIPKVIGGVTRRCGRLVRALYLQIVKEVIVVSSSRVAEMVKLLENTYRIVNIGLANEMALLCARLNVDIWEVIRAASTKPFGFMPFYPGPGVGGHCIGIDPVYLAWKARLSGFEPRFIDLASQINRLMPSYVVDKLGDALNKKGKSIKGAKILILGVAYKRDVTDTRESPAIEMIKLLKEKGARLTYHDPFVKSVKVDEVGTFESISLSPLAIRGKDCVVIVTDHTEINYKMVIKEARILIDTRGVTVGINKNKIVRI